MSAADGSAPRSGTIGRCKVAGAVREWLAEREFEGADLVRAEMAVALAAEIDDPQAPRYAKARVAGELRALLVEIEEPGGRDATVEARRLLAEVFP